ncbi:exosortase Y-associated Wzy-like protein [Pedobacter nototheniae]|uniref:exosortase Y-associated Wzy-like protein n=1 Tax=Pedobacter nototheniae TaxID=2488994 RepID=UPI00292CCE43|nr:hypothetical protein [Pedobacter nototheniae]
MLAKNFFAFTFLYIPFVLSFLFKDLPHTSYLIAWFGSFFIFYMAFSGRLKKLPDDLPVLQQLLRPIFLLHVIFVGYMACTSIFYYVNALGYEYFKLVNKSFLNSYLFEDIAKCQRYYVLGHAALVHGILFKMDYNFNKKYLLRVGSMSSFLFQLSIICLPLGLLFEKISFLNQFSVQLNGLSFVAGTIAFAFALYERKNTLILLTALLFLANLLKISVSGYKEPIIICFLLLGIFLIPVYGKKIIPLFTVILIALFILLPTFIGAYRGVAFSGGGLIEARDKGLDAVFDKGNLSQDLEQNYWSFLTNRLSEIDMFIGFTKSTPQFIPYYKYDLVEQGIQSIIPRALWSAKPVTENLVMDRVYRAGIISDNSAVSAKPAYIVDCFLSYGYPGIWIGLFLFGYIAQFISRKAEMLFGGYFLGSAVMFAGLFQLFWRGNSFEFMFNSVFWSYITMLIIFNILKAKAFLIKY